MRFSAWGPRLAAGLVLSLLIVGVGYAQERTGEISGVVVDESGAPVPGATIRAESRTLPRPLETVSDSSGRFQMLNVPIGEYTVTTSLAGFNTLKQAVEVKIGSQITYNPKLSVGQMTETIEVKAGVMSIDPTSSRTATNITRQQIEDLGKASRGFNALLNMAPGVRPEVKSGSSGVGGIQVDGASGSENAYYIDGVEVSDLRRGSLNSANAIPFEFVQEIAVKSGGFEAEFGGATGGVVNVATRSGTNEYHGSIGAQYTGSALNSTDRGFWQRSVANANVAEFFQPVEDSYRIVSPTATFGGPIFRDKLHFFTSYSPDFEHSDRDIAYTSGARSFSQKNTRHFSLARLDYTPSSKVQINTTYIWSPAKRNGNLPNRDPRIAAPANEQSIQGGYTPAQSATASLNYVPTSKLVLSARYGYKYYNEKDGNYGLSQDPYVVYNTSAVGLAGVPPALQQGTGFRNVSSTFGIVEDVTTRHNVYLDATYVTTIAGQSHNFKAGYALNRVANRLADDYTNGNFLMYWGDSFSRGSVTNERGTYGYYTWEDGIRHVGDVHSKNQAFYVQDTWHAGSRLTLNLGVRTENEFLPPFTKEVNGIKTADPVSFDWKDKIAPRLGFAYDVKGDGRWKVSGSFGVFYDVLKYELARGSFGGDYWVTHVYRLDNPDISRLGKNTPGALGPEIINFDNRTVPFNAAGELEGIDPDIKPYKTREFTIAFDHQFSGKLIGGIRFSHKQLLRAIEDIGVLDENDSEVYLIGNPGFGQTRDPSSVYGGQTPNGTFLVPEAKRKYDGVELRLQGEASGFHWLASYTWSRLFGNYSGPANSDESGRSDPGVSRAFDLPFYYFDESGDQTPKEGLLGTDRTHVFKAFAAYRFKTGAGSTNIGISQLAYSGTPDSTSVIYLSAPTFPHGRADMGRTPAYLQTDLNLAHTFNLTKGTSVRFEANVRNLFDQDSVISRVTQLNRSGAITAARLPFDRFFAGYDVDDFVSPGGSVPGTIPFNPIYGMPGASYRAGGGPGQSRAIGSIADRSAFSATAPGFGAFQDFRVIRIGVSLIF